MTGEVLTISVGAATTVPKRKAFDLVPVDAADNALYEAKNAGKNRFIAYEEIVAAPSDPQS